MNTPWLRVLWTLLLVTALGGTGCVPESIESSPEESASAQEALSIIAGYDLTNTPATVPVGGNATADFVAPAGHAATDWVGLYAVGTPPNEYIAWRYVGAATSGTVSVPVPANAVEGQAYELRYFLNNGSVHAATSPSFVLSAFASYSLDGEPILPSPGNAISIDWTAPAAHATTDWIGLYPVGGGLSAYTSWVYVGGAGTTSGTASLTISVNAAPGSAWELRYFKNNGYELAATSDAFTIGAGLTAPAGPVAAGSNVVTTWTTAASHATTDWIGLFRVGAANNAITTWGYVGAAGQTTGSLSLLLPASAVEGDRYELRYFLDNTYTLAGRSSSFEVGQGYSVVGPAGPVTPGPAIDATWTAPLTHSATDWIGLYAVGASPQSIVSFTYVGAAGSNGGSISVALPASTPSGTYELRYNTNNTYQVVATSNPFEVRLVAPVTLVANVPTVAGMVTDGLSIYFASGGQASANYLDGTVRRVALSGGTPTVIAGAYPSIEGIALDGNNVVFTSIGPGNDFGQGFVGRVPKAGGAVDIIAPNQAYCMWVVNAGGDYYWAAAGTLPAQWSDGAVRASIGGGAPITVADETDAVGVAVDGGYVYWISRGSPAASWTDGVLRRQPVGGGATETLATNLERAGMLLITGGRVYVTTQLGILQVDPSVPGVTTTFVASSDRIAQMASDGTHLFWTVAAGRVERRPLAAGAVQTVATGLNGPFAIFAYSGSLYVGLRGTGANDGGIVRVPY